MKKSTLNILFNKDGSNLAGLTYMIQKRRISNSKMVADKVPNLEKIIESPVNPLSLTSIIALALHQHNDSTKKYLKNYVNGEPLLDIEIGINKLMNNVDQNIKKDILELESDLIYDLMVLVLHEVIYGQPLGSSILYKSSIKEIVEGELNRDFLNYIKNYFTGVREQDIQELLELSIYWRIWHLINPVFTILPLSTDVITNILRNYGVSNNSLFHNEVEYVDEQLEKIKKQINKAISTNNRDNLKEVELKYKYHLKLQQRSQRFYNWNPEEIVVRINTIYARKSIYEQE